MKLTDTQLIILTKASMHPELIAMPLPSNLRGGAATKTVSSMIAKGLLVEVDANIRVGDVMWRETGDGHGVTLMATAEGMAAIGLDELTRAPTAAAPPMEAPTQAAPTPEPSAATPAPVQTKIKVKGRKQEALISMLKDGTTAVEAAAALDWEVHTVRGAIFGAIKKAGHTITSVKVEGRGRVYYAD